jgi:integrase
MAMRRFTQAFLNHPEDGTYTDGSGLYLAVRNGGKARSWSFRHRGHRLTIGPTSRVSLAEAQAKVRQYRDRLATGEDLFARKPEQERTETLREAVAAHYEHKCQGEWGKEAQELGRSMINNYINPSTYADLPLAEIDHRILARMFKPSWTSKPVISRRAIYMLREMFEIAIADGRYSGPNPALITKHSPLRRILGKQPGGGHRLGVPPESIPKLVAHLYEPLYAHGPDECTTAEAAEAIGCDPQAIHHAWRRGKLKNRRKLETPYDHRNAAWVYPIAELKKVFHFRKEPRQHAEVGPHAYVLLFLIYTAVRSDMGCRLRWDEVKEQRGIIDFRKRHKMAERDPEADYTIPITPEVKALLVTMKDTQQRNGTDTPYVFVHSPTKRIGASHYRGQTANPNTVNTYFKRCLVRLDLVNGETDPKKMPSVHGFRTTFPEWACDLKNYSRDYADAQLGHKHAGGAEVTNIYFRKVKYLNHRREMMNAWEQYCQSQPKVPSNI